MNKMAILVTSGRFENLNAAALVASGAIANDFEVLMFFMNDSVWALKKSISESKSHHKVSFPYLEANERIEKVDKSGRLQAWYKLLPTLKELGQIKIVACGLMTDVFGLEKPDLLDFVDDIAGVAFFAAEIMKYDKVVSL